MLGGQFWTGRRRKRELSGLLPWPGPRGARLTAGVVTGGGCGAWWAGGGQGCPGLAPFSSRPRPFPSSAPGPPPSPGPWDSGGCLSSSAPSITRGCYMCVHEGLGVSPTAHTGCQVRDRGKHRRSRQAAAAGSRDSPRPTWRLGLCLWTRLPAGARPQPLRPGPESRGAVGSSSGPCPSLTHASSPNPWVRPVLRLSGMGIP